MMRILLPANKQMAFRRGGSRPCAVYFHGSNSLRFKNSSQIIPSNNLNKKARRADMIIEILANKFKPRRGDIHKTKAICPEHFLKFIYRLYLP
jgi:hypothetical protein